ncbi:MAG: hypothetical protein RJA49_458 [Actinomycetota bacterium]
MAPASLHRLRAVGYRVGGEWVRRTWAWLGRVGAIGPDSAAGRKFGRFGQGSIICFPQNTIFNEHYIHIGEQTMIGPQATLSAGMVPGQQCLSDPVVRIGSRCLIGKGSGIVGHSASTSATTSGPVITSTSPTRTTATRTSTCRSRCRPSPSVR